MVSNRLTEAEALPDLAWKFAQEEAAAVIPAAEAQLYALCPQLCFFMLPLPFLTLDGCGFCSIVKHPPQLVNGAFHQNPEKVRPTSCPFCTEFCPCAAVTPQKATGPRLRRKPETDPVQTLFYSSVNGMGAGTFSRSVLS